VHARQANRNPRDPRVLGSQREAMANAHCVQSRRWGRARDDLQNEPIIMSFLPPASTFLSSSVRVSRSASMALPLLALLLCSACASSGGRIEAADDPPLVAATAPAPDVQDLPMAASEAKARVRPRFRRPSPSRSSARRHPRLTTCRSWSWRGASAPRHPRFGCRGPGAAARRRTAVRLHR
jgi:hypothetical protein